MQLRMTCNKAGHGPMAAGRGTCKNPRMKPGLVPALALAALLAACAPSLDSPAPSGCAVGAPASMVQMFFGRNVKDRVPVSDAEWQDFVETVVTPNFPDGFTILDAQGQWRNPQTGRTAGEASKVLVVAAPRGTDIRARIAAVSAAYKQWFAQQSVGVVTGEACAAF